MSTVQPPQPPQPPAPSEPTETSEQPQPRGGLNPRTLLALVVIVVIAGGVALLTTGGGGSHGVKSGSYDGLLVTPAKAEPALALRNYKGEAVNLTQYRGKAVFVTFLYTHCPDVCPLITANMRVAQNLMSPALLKQSQVIAVSVDPRGDNPQTVGSFLARHGMTGRMKYLLGSAHELAQVWRGWGVGSEQDAEQPQFVNHTGIIYGVSASGKVTTVYQSSFAPKEIVHDVPLLAAS